MVVRTQYSGDFIAGEGILDYLRTEAGGDLVNGGLDLIEEGLVQVTWSSGGNGKPRDLLGTQLVTSYHFDGANSWWRVDFLRHRAVHSALLPAVWSSCVTELH